MPLRAVIFDYGLVLSGPAVPSARARLLQLTGLPERVFDDHYWKYRLDYDRGTLNGPTYWQAIARDTGMSLSPGQVSAIVEQDVLLWASLNPIMLEWALLVQESGLKTAILSNMGEELLAHMRRNFGWLKTFDHHTWSCELNVVKPEAEIYTHTLQALGVAPQEALFLDDKLENVEGAHRVGLHALVFTGVEALAQQLQTCSWAKVLPPLPIGAVSR
ncbi:MAG TPA: HAD family phosphatase [Acidobacteriaceae bacterium]|nr:HAD family phosphatase [Acidobacteriaceae bacterium]